MATGQLRQTDRMAELKTVFGEDELSLVTVECDEGLSEEFEIRLEVVSQQEDLDFDRAIATHMTVKVKTNNGDTRYFDGLLTDARWAGHQGGYYRYKLLLRPLVLVVDQKRQLPDFQGHVRPGHPGRGSGRARLC